MNTFFPLNRCRISDKWQYNGMQVVWLENDLIRIGVLVGRGADVFEFRYKPGDVNFLLRLPGEIKNPGKVFAQRRDTTNQMEDYYYGGWQETLPNSAPFNYRGASLGQHGEVWGIPWDYSIVTNSPKEVAVKCRTRPMRTPLLVEKTLTITKGSPELKVHSSVTNESNTPFDLMWGQHIAFGLPFLKEGGRIGINAKKMVAGPAMPGHRRFKPGTETEWPQAITTSGARDDASRIPAEEEMPYSDLAFLSGFEDTGRYSIVNEAKKIGFGLEWDASLYKYVWYWQERYATQDAPWWGRAYAIALEPWTSKWTDDPEAAIKRGEWLRLAPNGKEETRLKAFAIDNNSDAQN